ncbi:MAG: hypothetical protein AB7P02_05140 [Alphaproteobacteria bacterium]
MKIATATLSSVAPYSQSRAHEAPKLDRETHDAYEQRTWREKLHVNDKGNVFIPPMSFKQSLDVAAKQLGLQIPGKGKSTYTKFFLSGVLCIDGPDLGIKKDDVPSERIHANSDGVRGSGKRVWRLFPTIREWRADVVFHVLANEITRDVFEDALAQAGGFVGIGRFRPQNGGYYGRWKVETVKWSEA